MSLQHLTCSVNQQLTLLGDVNQGSISHQHRRFRSDGVPSLHWHVIVEVDADHVQEIGDRDLGLVFIPLYSQGAFGQIQL